jgi:hypothetical protein
MSVVSCPLLVAQESSRNNKNVLDDSLYWGRSTVRGVSLLALSVPPALRGASTNEDSFSASTAGSSRSSPHPPVRIAREIRKDSNSKTMARSAAPPSSAASWLFGLAMVVTLVAAGLVGLTLDLVSHNKSSSDSATTNNNVLARAQNENNGNSTTTAGSVQNNTPTATNATTAPTQTPAVPYAQPTTTRAPTDRQPSPAAATTASPSVRSSNTASGGGGATQAPAPVAGSTEGGGGGPAGSNGGGGPAGSPSGGGGPAPPSYSSSAAQQQLFTKVGNNATAVALEEGIAAASASSPYSSVPYYHCAAAAGGNPVVSHVVLLHGASFTKENWRAAGILQDFCTYSGVSVTALDLSVSAPHDALIAVLQDLEAQGRISLPVSGLVTPSASGSTVVDWIFNGGDVTSLMQTYVTRWIPVAAGSVLLHSVAEYNATIADWKVLAIYGSADTSGARSAERLKEAVRDADVKELVGGHPVYLDSPVEFVQTVVDFLDRDHQ